MRTIYILGILVLLAVAVPAAPAQAGGVVTVCDEAHLLAALAGGGMVTFACSGTISLQYTITIAEDTVIDGSGQTVTISGNEMRRVLAVDPGVRLHLDRIIVTDGSDEYGGGLCIGDYSTVAVSNCTFSGNSVYFDSYPAYGAGGAIYNGQGATLTVNSSRFHANRAFHGMGGAIHNAGGTVTVTDSEFANNGDAEDGGAVSNYGGLVTVSRSTFADNRAFRNGGGIANIRGTVAVSDSTFFGNLTRFWSSSTGGGIYNRGVMYVSNSTFVGNQSSYGGGVSTFDGTLLVSNSTFGANRAASGGGGVYFWADNRAAVLKNTIVANSLEGGNCYGSIIDGGGNLSYPDATCPGINADPLLGPLQDNGGPTWTMALGEGSAAIDAADDAICAAPPVNNLDQRGFPRPWGAHCDIGAIEQVQEPVAVSLSTINAGSTPGAVAPTAVAGLLLLALGGCAAWGRRHTQQVG